MVALEELMPCDYSFISHTYCELYVRWIFVSLCNSFLLQDLPGALDDAAITEALELHKIKSRQWSIFKTSAVKGEGLFEGLDW